MTPTSEQEHFLQKPVYRAVIKALAGTGKTTLFRMFSQRYPELRILYISYNRSIVDEADLPENCMALTAHQLAYKFVGYRYEKKLSANLNMGLIKGKLGVTWAEANLTKNTLENFFYSQDKRICHRHVPVSKRNRKSSANLERITQLANQVWQGMCHLDGDFPMTHDGYLKGYSLADIDLSKYFDVLLVDEAQDLNPSVQSIIDAQVNMKVYLCGDDSQQIYRYRGAEDALSQADKSEYVTYTLTKSFRFNEQIASLANVFLSHLQVEERLSGTPNNISQSILEASSDLDPLKQIAFINRTILKTIEIAIELFKSGQAVMWVGGIEKYPFDEVLDILNLKLGKRSLIKSREVLRDYDDFDAYRAAAKATGSIDMARVLRIIKKYGIELFDIYRDLKDSEIQTGESATRIVSTCHRSKGLEFEQVVLGDDFKCVKSLLKRPIEEIKDELNLMYVGITRARLRLVPSQSIFEVCSEKESLLVQKRQVKSRRSAKRRIKLAA